MELGVRLSKEKLFSKNYFLAFRYLDDEKLIDLWIFFYGLKITSMGLENDFFFYDNEENIF